MSTAALDCPAQRFLPWFGANTGNAETAGELLTDCKYVVVMFAGSMAEVPHIAAREILVNDKHRDVMNLAAVVADPVQLKALRRILDWSPLCDSVRQQAIDYCKANPTQMGVERAAAYFIVHWMGRSGHAGKAKEFNGAVPIRTNANGGGTAKRYDSALRSLWAWHRVMRRCNFECLDWNELLDKYGGDDEWRGIYADAPWPDAGEKYLHKFTEKDHRALATRLSGYRKARVVVRYGDHPLIRELYPEGEWTWHLMDGRNQGNNAVREALIVRN